MIIEKDTMLFYTRSDKPNENWTDLDCYVLHDDSELAKKILDNYPNIELKIKKGEIKDVIIIEAETTEETETSETADNEAVTWAELDNAYSEGVNSAYEQ